MKLEDKEETAEREQEQETQDKMREQTLDKDQGEDKS